MTPAFRQPELPPRPPVSVWATGQPNDPARLDEGRYVPETARDAFRVPSSTAAHAIAAYTRAGDAILDPDCGAGTVLVEALHAGRHAIGVTGHPRWWPVARANVTAAKYRGATSDGMVLDSPAARGQLAGLCGRIALVLTAVRAVDPAHGRTRPPTARSTGAEIRGEEPSGRLRGMLTACRPLLRPDGHLIVVVRPRRHRDELVDLTGHVHDAAHAAGLIPVDRCVALLAELRGDRLVVPPSPAKRRRATRLSRSAGHPISLITHHDVLIFRAPYEEEAAAAVRPPHPPRMPHHVTDPAPYADPVREAA